MIHSMKLLDFRVPIVPYISLRNAQRPTGVCSLVPVRHLAFGLISLRLWLHSELPTFILHSLILHEKHQQKCHQSCSSHDTLEAYVYICFACDQVQPFSDECHSWFIEGATKCFVMTIITIWWFRKWWNCSFSSPGPINIYHYRTKALKWDPQTRLPQV